MPTNDADLQVEETVYLIRRGERVFAVRSALVEASELHDATLRAEALAVLDALPAAAKDIAEMKVVSAQSEGVAKAKKTFSSLI